METRSIYLSIKSAAAVLRIVPIPTTQLTQQIKCRICIGGVSLVYRADFTQVYTCLEFGLGPFGLFCLVFIVCEINKRMISNRLGKCNVCNVEDAKYTCPGCETKTCSLSCVQQHKDETSCDGMRNKTAYKHMSKFTNMDLLNDYRLLEDISRKVDIFHRNPELRFTRQRDLPKHLHYLRNAAHQRRMRLWFLPQNFKQHKVNTTYLNWTTKVIEWKIEWTFPNAEPDKIVVTNDRVSEDLLMSQSMEKILSDPGTKENLGHYSEIGLSGIAILLTAESIKNASKRYFVMDLSISLRQNLEGHTLVEFPCFVVVPKENLKDYCIITLDDIRAERNQDMLKNREKDKSMLKKTMESPSSTNCGEPQQKICRTNFPTYKELCDSDSAK